MTKLLKYALMSSVCLSPLSELGGGTTDETVTVLAWDTMTEEQRQSYFDQVKSTVASGDTDLDDYKNAYKDAYTEDTTLADDDIIWMIARYEIDGPDMDAVVLAMKDAEEGEATGDEPESDAVLADVKSQAVGVAEKLAADADFKAELDKIIEAGEIVARGPVATMIHLQRLWDDGDWAQVPDPGSKKPEDGKPTNITIYDITVTKATGTNRKLNISWFTEAARIINAKLFADQEDAKEVLKPVDQRMLTNDQRKEWNKLSPLKKQNKLKTMNSRVNRYTDLLKRAVRTKRLIQALKDVTNKTKQHPIGVDLAWDVYPKADNNHTGQLSDGNSPIMVYDALAPLVERRGDAYTVTTFLKFDAGLKKMLASGVEPSYTELDDTLGRNRDAMAAQKRTNRFKIENMEDALFSFASIANFFDNQENLRMYKKHLETKKKVLEAGADPRLMTEYEMEQFQFGETMMKVLPVWTYIKASGFDALWEANKRGEKLTSDDLLTLEDNAKVADKQRKVA